MGGEDGAGNQEAPLCQGAAQYRNSPKQSMKPKPSSCTADGRFRRTCLHSLLLPLSLQSAPSPTAAAAAAAVPAPPPARTVMSMVVRMDDSLNIESTT